MPIKGNQFKSNSFREENPPRQPSDKGTKPRSSRPVGDSMPVFNLQDGRLIKIAGLFFLILSIFFLIAFTSYLFTWEQDQSYVSANNGGWSNLFKTQAELLDKGITDPVVDNWLGKFGALLSNQFMFEWFGVASFVFVFVFFIMGYRMLFKVRIFSLGKTLAYSFFVLIFLSVAVGFVHAFIIDYPHFLEGQFGFWSNRLLDAQIGQAGTGGVLVFAALTVLIIAYNIDFKLPQRKPKLAVADDDIDIASPESIELIEEMPSKPVEWPRTGAANSIKAEPVKAVEPEAVFHETVVLRPDDENADPEIGSDIPLTLEVERPTPVLNVEKADDDKAKSLVDQFGTYDHKLDLASYKMPPLDLLENYGSNKIQVNSEELEANKNKIVETLNHYNIEIDKIKATIGPTVTL